MERPIFTDLIGKSLSTSRYFHLAVIGSDRRHRFVNDLYQARFSFLNTELIGAPFPATLYSEDIEKCELAFQYCMANPQAHETVTVRVRSRKPDEPEWMHYEFSLFEDEEDQQMGILCMGHLIPARDFPRQVDHLSDFKDVILENVSDGFYMVGMDWRLLKVNQSAEKMIGAPRKSLLGRSIWDVLPRGSEFKYAAQFQKALHESVAVSFEDRLPNSEKRFEVKACPSFGALKIFFRDTTSERLVTAQLQASENKLRAILDSTTDSNTLVDSDFKVLNFNKTAKRLVKLRLNRQLREGDDFLDLIPEANRPEFKENFCKALTGKMVRVVKQIPFLHNQKLWTEISLLPVFEDGTIIGVAVNSRNIHDRKLAEDRLRQSEYMLNAIYNSTTDANAFLSTDCKIRYTNKTTEEMIQMLYGRSPIVGEDFSNYVLPHLAEDFRSRFQQALTGSIVHTEIKSGDQWYQSSLFPVYDHQQKVIGVANNLKEITERKKNELEIISQNEKLKAISWQLSHEMRAPLARIMAVINLVGMGDNNDETVKCFDILRQTTEELDQVIRSVAAKTNNL